MANRYFIPGTLSGGHYFWGDSSNWSLTSGGAGGESIPTSADDVFLDINSPACYTGDGNFNCNNLTISAGKSLIFGQVNFLIFGTFTATGSSGSHITITGDSDYNLFCVGGAVGTVQYVDATNLRSIGGIRIINLNGTLNNCPFWRTTTPQTLHVSTTSDLVNLDGANSYILDNGIDMTGITWSPISAIGDAFTGEFDGQGFTISNLTYDDTIPNTGVSALFGNLGSISRFFNEESNVTYERAYIHDLTLENFDLTGKEYVGALFGYSGGAQLSNIHCESISIHPSGTSPRSFGGIGGWIDGGRIKPTSIDTCTVNVANITGLGFVGGMFGNVGYFDADIADMSISNCSALGINIVITSGSRFDVGPVGGLLGGFSGQLQNSHAEVTVTSPTNFILSCGGLVGELQDDVSTIDSCHAQVSITGQLDFDIGGLIGGIFQPTTVSNCYSTGTITGTQTHWGPYGVGGLIGEMDEGVEILVCHSTVSISISETEEGSFFEGIGGLVGEVFSADNNIHQCYATGNITCVSLSNDAYGIGGFIGESFDASTGFDVADCFSKGNVHYEGVGGFCEGIGGFMGYSSFIALLDSYSAGNVTVVGSFSDSEGIGGFIGQLENHVDTSVKNSYSVGLLDTIESLIGGFIGQVDIAIKLFSFFSNYVLDSGAYAIDFSIKGNTLFVVYDQLDGLDRDYTRLISYDITDITAPVVISNLSLEAHNDIFGQPVHILTSGNYAYITAGGGWDRVCNIFGCSPPNYGGVVIVNITDPSSMSYVTYFSKDTLSSSSLYGPSKMAKYGNYLIVVSPDNAEADIFDVTTPASPSWVANVSPGLLHFTDVIVSGNNLIGIGQSSIKIWDITTPSSPTLLGGVSDGTGGITINYGDRLIVKDHYLIYTTTAPVSGILIEILDISNPASITFVSSYNTSLQLAAMALVGNDIYFSMDSGSPPFDNFGLAKLDISTIASPVLSYTTFSSLNYFGLGRLLNISGNFYTILQNGTTPIPYHFGIFDIINSVPTISNCSWWTGATSSAIGQNPFGDLNTSLVANGYGTDEADNTAFYSKTHPVYAQGDLNEWSFFN